MEIKKISFFNATNMKYIAIIAMLSDHLAITFVEGDSPLYIIMRMIGRFTAPILFFLTVESYHHTKNLKKYLSGLFVFFAVSYVPYIFFHNLELPNPANWYQFNVMYTIFLGVIALYIKDYVNNSFLKVAFLLVIIILSVFGDWGYMCILIILVFDFFRGNRKNQILGYCMLIILNNDLIPLIRQPFMNLVRGEGSFAIDMPIGQLLSIVSLFLPAIIIYNYNGEKGSNSSFSKWFFYLFYPLHLLVLGVVSYFI